MVRQPEGTVTFLFSDIEGSTRLLERLGTDCYAGVLEQHRQLLRESFDRHGGYEVDCEGDAFIVAFGSAQDAVTAAVESQHALAAAGWPEEGQVRVRMGLHTGEPLAAPPKYVGMDVHKAARIMAAGHGGQVLLSSATQRLVGNGVDVISLGEQRLRDLSQPEVLYQLRIEGLPSEFPALKTLPDRSTNLPVVASALIGREVELAEIEDVLLGEGVRILTLTGPGGIGKTRLALHAAADAIDHFDDGVYYVPLAPVREAELVLPTIAQTLGLRDEAGESGALLSSHLEQRRLLLVVDNLEHVIGAASPLASLLAIAPGLRILATSREALRVAGEYVYDVPPLAAVESVQLFGARAKAADSRFALTPENEDAIDEIVRRLDGLPLAIELAAARVRMLPPETLLRRLDSSLRLLTGGSRDAEQRHQTLRATIEWSVDLLTAEERRLMTWLSVFVGGFRLEAAETVCEPTFGLDAFEGIASLIDKSLLRRRTDPDGERRYWMLEPIRDFAAEQLAQDPEEEREAQESYVEAIDALATDLYPRLRSTGSLAALARFAAEHANLRAALALARDRSLDEVSVRLTQRVSYVWYLSGRLEEAAPYASRALELTAGRRDGLRLFALDSGAEVARIRDPHQALPLVEEAIAIASEIGDRSGLLRAVHQKSLLLQYNDAAHEETRGATEQALALARELGDQWYETILSMNLGDLALREQRFDEALARSEEALENVPKVGDQTLALPAAANRGAALIGLGRLAEAVAEYTEVIAASEAAGYLESIPWATSGLAAAAVAAGAPEEAALLLGYTEHLLTTYGYTLAGVERRLQQDATTAARSVLSADEFDLQFGRGVSLAKNEGVTELLATVAAMEDLPVQAA